MAKFFGNIGYQITTETEPGLYEEQIIEYEYSGDVLRNSRRLQYSDEINPSITMNKQISIISDPYSVENLHNMRYVTYMGSKWIITSADIQYPRIILTLGGIYNG